ncbi:Prolyl-tRNA synthetase [Halapricum desulfuricans]|uniref:proline--tRNA ligase n=2 Tax=Halapricum desulfuricans TaxID=2841257 RepID=A0A897MZA4_9EURY|nr:Prolyl-tRNA synthetase [Halapricum desulfuricans]
MVRSFGAGLWGLTPVGQRTRRKLLRHLRAVMSEVDGQEVHLPGLQYRDRWEQSGRWESFENEMFTLRNRDGQELCLAPSHEEGMVHLVDGRVRSYDDLPVLVYQIATKFRDDRPRNGLVRSKEFTMKDAYSFHASESSLGATYRRIREAYLRLFDDLGLTVAVVEADNSVMGGSRSEEFVAPVENGSHRLRFCRDCRFGVSDEHGDLERFEGGDDCPECGGTLTASEAIEVGHIFELGTRYSERMGLTVDLRDGSSRDVLMGSYGIGVERLLQTIAQQHADTDGLSWPVTGWGSIAPFRAAIVPIGDDESVRETAETLYARCGPDDVLLFDGDRSPGERFAESDLLGIPVKLILGNQFRETGNVELEFRDGQTDYATPGDVPEIVSRFAAGRSGG